jgi:hypothetical protein
MNEENRKKEKGKVSSTEDLKTGTSGDEGGWRGNNSAALDKYK